MTEDRWITVGRWLGAAAAWVSLTWDEIRTGISEGRAEWAEGHQESEEAGQKGGAATSAKPRKNPAKPPVKPTVSDLTPAEKRRKKEIAEKRMESLAKARAARAKNLRAKKRAEVAK